MNLDALDITILGPAFIAGLLVLFTHVPLGRIVLKRGIIFIDLAIAQIAGLGVIAAHSYDMNASGWLIQGAAVSAALVGAVILNWTDKHFQNIQEAIIGISFVLAATMGMLLLANNPHGGEQLKELLVGQILWISYEQLIPVAMIYTIIMAIWVYLDIPNLHRMGFYLIFAVTVTASVQLVGVYLVFASLIIPALATRMLSGAKCLIIAYLVGLTGYLAGLIASALLDLPTGAIIVWTLAIVGILVSLIFRSEADEDQQQSNGS